MNAKCQWKHIKIWINWIAGAIQWTYKLNLMTSWPLNQQSEQSQQKVFFSFLQTTPSMPRRACLPNAEYLSCHRLLLKQYHPDILSAENQDRIQKTKNRKQRQILLNKYLQSLIFSKTPIKSKKQWPRRIGMFFRRNRSQVRFLVGGQKWFISRVHSTYEFSGVLTLTTWCFLGEYCIKQKSCVMSLILLRRTSNVHGRSWCRRGCCVEDRVRGSRESSPCSSGCPARWCAPCRLSEPRILRNGIINFINCWLKWYKYT